MTKLTRRSLLKTGLAASAGLISADGNCYLPNAEAELGANESHAGLSSPNDGLAKTVSPRERLLLDSGWRFHLGDADNAANDFRWGTPTREGTFAKAGQDWLHNPLDGSLQHSFDDGAWRIVDLPHDWAVELPFIEIAGPNGPAHAAHGGKALGREFPKTSIGWYERTFDIPAKNEGLRISLEFDGVFRDAIILFNGFYLGRNFSGYAPFSFDITDYAKYGSSNVVTVRVDATLNEGWYYEGAGIYRHTWLVKTDPLHIVQWGTFVRSEVQGKGARISIQTEILNESSTNVSGLLISHILNPGGEIVAVAPSRPFEISARGNLTLETAVSLARVALWSLEEPHLYRVVTQIESGGRVIDEDEATFGIRSIRFDPDHGFFLNGKSVKIKGTCNHQDHAGVGIAVPDRIQYERVEVLKQMGSNGWRTAHNPVAPELLDACDQLGMMVMAETRMMASTPEGLSELERMIRRDRNHPSIVIWSLANEEYFYQGTSTGARIISSMKSLAKKLDPTRPVTAAMNGSWGRGVSAVVDVQGFNYWNGGLPDEKSGKKGLPASTDIDRFHAQFPKLSTLGTETANGQSVRGIYETDPKQGYVYGYKAGCPDCKTAAEIWWTIFDERAFLSGGFTWAGFDYRGEPTPYDHIAISAQSGIVDTCGFPKDIYYYYKSWWGSEPVLHLFPHWNWSGKEGQELDVRCYSNLDRVELFLNERSLGSKPVLRNSHLQWNVRYEPGAIEARGLKDGKVVLVERRETTGAPTKLVIRPGREKIAADGQDVLSIVVEVRDAQGRLVPTASNKIRLKVAGPGKIIGIGNGDPSCHEADKPDDPDSAERSAFNGLCVAFVQATKQAGTIQVDALADGLEPKTVTFQSETVKLRPFVD
jgi:beta-galactosidase